MPNGTDCSNILQSEALCVPTQWVVMDCTTDSRVSGWLRADVAGEIDYISCGDRVESRDDPKATLIQGRPTVLNSLVDAYHLRKAEGSQGRLAIWVVADLSDPVGNRLLAELPLDIANLMFWESGLVPVVIRAGIGGDNQHRRHYLSSVRDQYFGFPDFSAPYYGKHTPGQMYGNEFDSTLLTADNNGLRRIVEALVPLHLVETRFAKSHLQRERGGGLFVIEEAMKESLRWRKIDWLSAVSYPYFHRLWDADHEDILDVLDYSRCPKRHQNPWAALEERKRETDWHHIDLDPQPFDPLMGEQAYRITRGDHRSRLALAQFLLRHRLYVDVVAHCRLARDEGGYQVADLWLKVEGLAQRGLGNQPDSSQLLGEYRTKLEATSAPSANTLDEIASMALVEGDFTAAYEWALKAVKRDHFLGHAYDAMVIAGRQCGNPSYEEHATKLAQLHGVTIPIHICEKTDEALRSAKAIEPKLKPTPVTKKWWLFWK